MGYNIGSFKKNDGSYEGKIETLTHKIQATFHPLLDRTHQNAPAYEIYSGDLRIGAAWERTAKKGGRKYLSVNLEDPSFSPGFYSLYRNSSIENGYDLVFDRPSHKPKTAEASQQAA